MEGEFMNIKKGIDKIDEFVKAWTIEMIGVCLFSLAYTIPVYFLWNWLIPSIFGFNAITIFQAWGLNFLFRILFQNPE